MWKPHITPQTGATSIKRSCINDLHGIKLRMLYRRGTNAGCYEETVDLLFAGRFAPREWHCGLPSARSRSLRALEQAAAAVDCAPASKLASAVAADPQRHSAVGSELI